MMSNETKLETVEACMAHPRWERSWGLYVERASRGLLYLVLKKVTLFSGKADMLTVAEEESPAEACRRALETVGVEITASEGAP